MTGDSGINLRWPVAVASAVVLMAIGAGSAYVLMRPRPQPAPSRVQTAKIVVGEQGFEPAKVTLQAGVPARLTFVRTTDKTCGTEVLFPSLKLERALPLNESVNIDFTPAKSGDIAFACGMDMLRGSIVVQ